MKKPMKKVRNIDQFMQEVNKTAQQHDDGLISRGEFVHIISGHLDDIAEHDLRDAMNVFQSYGHSCPDSVVSMLVK